MPVVTTKTQRFLMWLLQGGRCAICGEVLPAVFEMELIGPGKTTLANLWALCVACHRGVRHG
jgi:hypothetical protein